MRLLFIASLLLVTVAAPALADTEHPAIADARRQLQSYDLEGSTTTAVLAELGRIDRTAYMHELQQAQFLRSAAAADLLLLAHLKNLPELTVRVAEAYDVAPAQVVTHVRSELSEVRGVYAPIVEDAAAALDRMRGVRGQHVEGPRSDAFLVHDVLVAARRDDAIAALAPLGENRADLPFDRTGRRAVEAVAASLHAVERLTEAAAHGDPFAAQLTEDLPERRRALRAIELAPLPAMDESLGLGRVARGTPVRPDLVLSVHPNEVRYTFIPRVRFPDGDPELVSAYEPTFPATASVPLEGLRAWPRPVEALVEALRSRVDADTAVAIGGAPDAEAHLLTRAWQSVSRAGVEPRWIVAESTDGLLAGVPAAATREASGRTEIFVRLGGHSVSRRGARSTSIPRERTEDGWRHDWEELAEVVRGPAALRYMGVVSLQTLVETAFVVGDRVTLDFP